MWGGKVVTEECRKGLSIGQLCLNPLDSTQAVSSSINKYRHICNILLVITLKVMGNPVIFGGRQRSCERIYKDFFRLNRSFCLDSIVLCVILGFDLPILIPIYVLKCRGWYKMIASHLFWRPLFSLCCTQLLLRSLLNKKLPDFGCTALYISQVIKLVVLGSREAVWLLTALFERSLLFKAYYKELIIDWVAALRSSILLAILEQQLRQGILRRLPLNGAGCEGRRRVLVIVRLLIIILTEAAVTQHLLYLLRDWQVVIAIFDIEVGALLQCQANRIAALARPPPTTTPTNLLASQHGLGLMVVHLLLGPETSPRRLEVVLG